MEISKGYELNDLLLVPELSDVNSREDVSLWTKIGNLELNIPIIASPMSGIVGVELIMGLSKLGGIGILHRFYNDSIKRTKDLQTLTKSSVNFGIAVGLDDNFYKEALDGGANIICIDVANGYLRSVADFTLEVSKYIKKNGYDCLVMSGNVATFDGAKALYDSGAKLIRVGIGSGKLCTTRNNTGIGSYQATVISDCSHENQTDNKVFWSTVADGGIKTSGDIVKSLALGADFVMIGSMLARTFESDNNGKIAGMASREFQEQFYGEVKKSVEGIQIEVKKDISLEELINELCWNVKSGFTYCNARNIKELQKNAQFIAR